MKEFYYGIGGYFIIASEVDEYQLSELFEKGYLYWFTDIQENFSFNIYRDSNFENCVYTR